TIAPVGQASRQPAFSQCLQTSEWNSQGALSARCAGATGSERSTNCTCRQVEWESSIVLSYERPLQRNPSPGTSFHSLQATSQALQPMQSVESVKKPVTLTTRSPEEWCVSVRPRHGRSWPWTP